MSKHDRMRRALISLPLMVAAYGVLVWWWGWNTFVHYLIPAIVVTPIYLLFVAVGRRGFPR